MSFYVRFLINYPIILLGLVANEGYSFRILIYIIKSKYTVKMIFQLKY